MGRDLTERMAQWRNGELLDSEMLSYLMEAQCEIILAMRNDETKEADARMARLGLAPVQEG